MRESDDIQGTYQLVIFILHFESGGDPLPGIQERFPLRMLSAIVYVQTNEIHCYKYQHITHYLKIERETVFITIIIKHY